MSAVVLDSNQLINTTTDVSGSFTLTDIPAGTQKVNFSISGYAATNATATVVVDTTASLGNVPMTSSYSTGTIAGTITDSTGKPLADVAITITGAWSGSATTGADGNVLLHLRHPRHSDDQRGKNRLPDRNSSRDRLRQNNTHLLPPDEHLQHRRATTGTLVGRVVDSYWGVPIGHLPEEKGVTVTLSGGISVEPDPDNGGYFILQGLAPNTYQVTVGMNGFTSRTFRVVIMAGGITDLGTVHLEMTISKMTLTGKVTDASTGAPIPGAEVAILGNAFIGRADFAGTYAIADIPHPDEYTVKASAAGYVGKSYTVGSSPWTQTMDITLTPQMTKGSLTGTVVDASANQPLSGVVLTFVSDPSISATTDSAGAFTFNAVSKGPQQIGLSLMGYTQRTLTTGITAGVVNNVGSIALSVNPLAASIQGTVRDAVINAPFAGVNIQATGTGSLQSVTAENGTYKLHSVNPGTVTVAATAAMKTGYYPASFTGTLEPGGILVFSPALSTLPPTTVDVTVQTDKSSYYKGDTVRIAINLRNSEYMAFASSLHVRIIDASGNTAHDSTLGLYLSADATIAQILNVVLPFSAPEGTFKIVADLSDANGMLLGVGTKNFGMATGRISVKPTIPPALTTGSNTVAFTLANTGDLPVSVGVLDVTLKDPDGEIVFTGDPDVRPRHQGEQNIHICGLNSAAQIRHLYALLHPKRRNYRRVDDGDCIAKQCGYFTGI